VISLITVSPLSSVVITTPHLLTQFLSVLHRWLDRQQRGLQQSTSSQWLTDKSRQWCQKLQTLQQTRHHLNLFTHCDTIYQSIIMWTERRKLKQASVDIYRQHHDHKTSHQCRMVFDIVHNWRDMSLVAPWTLSETNCCWYGRRGAYPGRVKCQGLPACEDVSGHCWLVDNRCSRHLHSTPTTSNHVSYGGLSISKK